MAGRIISFLPLVWRGRFEPTSSQIALCHRRSRDAAPRFQNPAGGPQRSSTQCFLPFLPSSHSNCL